MALVKCSECAREISDKAASCPGCGAPVVVAGSAPVDSDYDPDYDELGNPKPIASTPRVSTTTAFVDKQPYDTGYDELGNPKPLVRKPVPTAKDEANEPSVNARAEESKPTANTSDEAKEAKEKQQESSLLNGIPVGGTAVLIGMVLIAVVATTLPMAILTTIILVTLTIGAGYLAIQGKIRKSYGTWGVVVGLILTLTAISRVTQKQGERRAEQANVEAQERQNAREEERLADLQANKDSNFAQAKSLLAEGEIEEALKYLGMVKEVDPQYAGLDAALDNAREVKAKRRVYRTEKPRKRAAKTTASVGRSSSIDAQAKAIPDDVTYTIIDENIAPGIKRSLDIRLNRKVSEGVLQYIAMKLKNSDPTTYDRTFIGYYLPDMKVNAGYWATTHFNPNLEVRILGLTAEQEEVLKQQPADPSREVIGSWLDGRPFGGGRITILRKDGKLFLENKYKDGSVGTAEIVETRSRNGRRFDYKPDRGHGEYYLINSRGELQQLDQDGPFMTAKKVN